MPAAPCIRRPEPMRWLLALLLLMLPLAVLAQQPLHDPQPLQFRDSAEERRFHDLAAQLRCVQCQNQSLADSNAQIAQDLRREVLQLMQQGHVGMSDGFARLNELNKRKEELLLTEVRARRERTREERKAEEEDNKSDAASSNPRDYKRR